jgi:hypothetical protein
MAGLLPDARILTATWHWELFGGQLPVGRPRQPGGTGGETAYPAGLAHGEDQPDSLGAETARDERAALRRGPVEPLRVVHDADQRLPLRRRRHQAQPRQADVARLDKGRGRW